MVHAGRACLGPVACRPNPQPLTARPCRCNRLHCLLHAAGCLQVHLVEPRAANQTIRETQDSLDPFRKVRLDLYYLR